MSNNSPVKDVADSIVNAPEKEAPPERKPAHEILADYIKEQNIILDYEIINDRVFQVDDGLILKPKNPLIKITVKYGSR